MRIALFFPCFVMGLALVPACAKTAGIDGDDLAKLDVQGAPADVAKRIPKSDAQGTRIYASFKKDGFFDQLQLDWNGSQGRAAPQWIALEASKEATNDERTRLAAVLHGGLLPGDAWIFGPIRIALKENGSLEGTVDPKPGGAPNPSFEKQAAIMMRVFAHAGFDAPLGVSDADMRDSFGGGYPVTSLAKIDPETPASGAAAHVTSIFPGASANGTHLEIALNHPAVPFVRLDWDDAQQNGTLKKVMLTETWTGDHKAFDACMKKSTLPQDVKLEVGGTIGSLSGVPVITKEAWGPFVASLDACR